MRFNPRDELISELTTYGVIGKGTDGKCEIVNPVYLHCIIEAFTPAVNGLERNYFAENNSQGFRNYLTPAGQLDMGAPSLITSKISSHASDSRSYKCQKPRKNTLADTSS